MIHMAVHRAGRLALFEGMAAVVLVASAMIVCAADWPHWRGSGRDGGTAEQSGWANDKWLPDKPEWTAQVGEGASSPLVVEGRLYTMGWRDGRDQVQCRAANTGKPLWSVNYACPQ